MKYAFKTEKLPLDIFGRNRVCFCSLKLSNKNPDTLMGSKVPFSKPWVINKYIIVTKDPRETSATSHGKLNSFLQNMSFQPTNMIDKQKSSM